LSHTFSPEISFAIWDSHFTLTSDMLSHHPLVAAMLANTRATKSYCCYGGKITACETGADNSLIRFTSGWLTFKVQKSLEEVKMKPTNYILLLGIVFEVPVAAFGFYWLSQRHMPGSTLSLLPAMPHS
jgi:hypothetical protein